MHSMLLKALFALLVSASSAPAATLEDASPRGSGIPGTPIDLETTERFCQLPDPDGTGLSSQIDREYPWDSGCVDDYVSNGGPVCGIDWWGTYWNYIGQPSTVDSWVITFYLDDGNCYPGDVVATRYLQYYTETFDGTWYELSAYFNAVPQVAGQRYWIEIQGVMVFAEEGQWGWVTSLSDAGGCGPPMQGFRYLQIPYWTAQPQYTGLAFCLRYCCVPTEDATLSSIKALY